MRRIPLRTVALLAGLAGLLALGALADELKIVTGKLAHAPAQRIPGITGKVLVTGAARAGTRLVAVGDHGAVLLSDDAGRTFRQAQEVPTRATLTAVSFADAQHGWAVGHWGVILATTDGGEHWTLQRDDLAADRPLLTVWFRDAQNGMAAGIWSTCLGTHDGGKSWTPVAVPAPPGSTHADLNLFQGFSDGQGGSYVVAERGMVLHSPDDGGHWEFHETGSRGSLWAGVRLQDGSLVVGGLLGKMFRSSDAGRTWQPVDIHTDSSITGLAEQADGKVLAVGLDGVSAASQDHGQSFQVSQREDRLSLTAIGVTETAAVLFSKQGVVAPEAAR